MTIEELLEAAAKVYAYRYADENDLEPLVPVFGSNKDLYADYSKEGIMWCAYNLGIERAKTDLLEYYHLNDPSEGGAF